jgi:hypothetical protein
VSTKSMRVTGLAVQSLTKFDLKGTGIGSNLRKITVTLDANPPPSPGAASGSVGDVSADLKASQSVWDDLDEMLASFPFEATIHYTGSGVNTVNDLTFAEIAATSVAIAEDVHILRKYAEKFATKLLAVQIDDTGIHDRPEPASDVG